MKTCPISRLIAFRGHSMFEPRSIMEKPGNRAEIHYVSEV